MRVMVLMLLDCEYNYSLSTSTQDFDARINRQESPETTEVCYILLSFSFLFDTPGHFKLDLLVLSTIPQTDTPL